LSAEWIAATVRFLLLGFASETTVDELVSLRIQEALDKLNSLNTGTDNSSISSCKSLVAALRTLVVSCSYSALFTLSQSLSILSKAAELCPEDGVM
jgi:hypothetical protein